MPKEDYQKEIANSLQKIVKLLKIQTEFSVGYKVELNNQKEVKNVSTAKTKKRKK